MTTIIDDKVQKLEKQLKEFIQLIQLRIDDVQPDLDALLEKKHAATERFNGRMAKIDKKILAHNEYILKHEAQIRNCESDIQDLYEKPETVEPVVAKTTREMVLDELEFSKEEIENSLNLN